MTVIEALVARAGAYVGEGINHEGEPFTGRLELSPVVGKTGLTLAFVATGTDGTAFHEEHTVVGPGEGGQPTLWTLSNNAPALVTLALRREHDDERVAGRAFVFGTGAADDRTAFRMELELDLWDDGDVEYRFAWGLPGGEFAPRSGVRMRPVSKLPVPEATLAEAESGGKAPAGPGWFVVNVANSRWYTNEAFGASAPFEGKHSFSQVGVNVHVLQPGQPSCMYHQESDQEDFLVLSGECLLLVEGQERPLKTWDFVHCPPWTKHVFVGAGDGPCAVLMLGARSPSGGVHYPVSELARQHGASVEQATDSPKEAYAPCPKWTAGAPLPWPLAP